MKTFFPLLLALLSLLTLLPCLSAAESSLLKYTAICGLGPISGYTTLSNGHNVQFRCNSAEMPGSAFQTVPSSSPADCEQRCADTRYCRSSVWMWSPGPTCRLSSDDRSVHPVEGGLWMQRNCTPDSIPQPQVHRRQESDTTDNHLPDHLVLGSGTGVDIRPAKEHSEYTQDRTPPIKRDELDTPANDDDDDLADDNQTPPEMDNDTPTDVMTMPTEKRATDVQTKWDEVMRCPGIDNSNGAINGTGYKTWCNRAYRDYNRWYRVEALNFDQCVEACYKDRKCKWVSYMPVYDQACHMYSKKHRHHPTNWLNTFAIAARF